MKMTGIIPICFFGLLAFLGCSREKTAQRLPVGLNYWELPGSAVVVKVNDYELTKAENERRIELRLALAQMQGRKLNEQQKRDLRFRLLRASEFSFVQDILATDWGKANGIFFTEDERKNGRAKFAKNITRGSMDYHTLKTRLADIQPEYIDNFVDLATYNAKCADAIAKENELPVAANEVCERRKCLIEYNERVAATNAMIWAAASNLWKRIQQDAGAFDAEVAKYQENEAEHIFSDPDMGEVPLSFFDGDPVWKERLAKAKEGDILPPRIGDNGLLMVKILKCIPIEIQENGKEPRWRFAKMFWELGAEWEPQTDAQILADLKAIRHREGRERGFKKLFESAQISYPSGTNLLKRARAKRKQLPNDYRIPDRVRQKIEQGE